MDFTHYDTLHLQQAGAILTVMFNRPDVTNAANAAMERELCRVFMDVNHDPDIRAVVLTGAGRVFSAGGDFEYIRELISTGTRSAWEPQLRYSAM
jgi:enoyl-CoA hydratase